MTRPQRPGGCGRWRVWCRRRKCWQSARRPIPSGGRSGCTASCPARRSAGRRTRRPTGWRWRRRWGRCTVGANRRPSTMPVTLALPMRRNWRGSSTPTGVAGATRGSTSECAGWLVTDRRAGTLRPSATATSGPPTCCGPRPASSAGSSTGSGRGWATRCATWRSACTSEAGEPSRVRRSSPTWQPAVPRSSPIGCATRCASSGCVRSCRACRVWPPWRRVAPTTRGWRTSAPRRRPAPGISWVGSNPACRPSVTCWHRR